MWYIGVDAHKKNCQLTAKNETGALVARCSFKHTRDGWRNALKDAPSGSIVAIECVGWYQPIFDLLDELGFDGVLVHAKDVALIAKSNKKTDKRDSEILCDLLRTDYLPKAHVPSKWARELRELTRQLDRTVKATTSIKNQVHRLLERAWIERPGVSDLFGKDGLAFLETVELSTCQRVVLDALLTQLETLTTVRDRLEVEIAHYVEHDEDTDLLLGIDGLSFVGAATLRAEMDDVTRFKNRRAVRSNFGMCPSVRDSADTTHRGRITKQGPGVVRKILVQGALHFANNNPNTGKKYARIARQRGKSVARVAAGADLLDVAYQVLKTRTPYHHARPTRLKNKRRDLQRRAAHAPATTCVS